MKRLGFTPQKPIKRAYEQDPKAVDKWLKEDYPKIEERARKEEAEIHWLDETRLNTYSNYVRSYSPRRKTPILRMKCSSSDFILQLPFDEMYCQLKSELL